MTAEFEVGQSHIYRLLDEAQIEHNIDQQRKAWRQAVETAPEGQREADDQDAPGDQG